MAKRPRIPKTHPLQHEKHRVRAVFGQANTPVRGGKAVPIDEVYRQGLRQALLDARSKLNPADRERYFSWLETFTSNPAIPARSALSFGPSRFVLEAPKLSLVDELDWLDRRISSHFADLRRFRSLVSLLDLAFWSERESAAFEIVDEIERSFGVSLWLIETRIALSQYFHGLDAQKGFTSTIRDRYPATLPAFYAHFVSVRNEDRSTLKLYREDTLERIKSTKIKESAKTYLRFKLSDDVDHSPSSILSIIRSEQSQSIIDIYETSIRLFQHICREDAEERYAGILTSLGLRWASIGDFRLDKIAIAYGVRPLMGLQQRLSPVAAPVVSGNMSAALRAASRALRENPTDVWCGVERSFVASLHGRAPPRGEGPWSLVHASLASVFARDDQFERSLGTLTKFSRNFCTLPTAAALYEIAGAAAEMHSSQHFGFGAAALHSPLLSGADHLLSQNGAGAGVGDAVEALWMGLSPQGAESNLTALATYFRAARSLRDRLANQAFEAADSLDDVALPAPIRSMASGLAIEAALTLGELDVAIRKIADEASNSPSARSILPVDAAIRDRPWSDLANFPSKLDLAIALDVLWRRTNDDLRATHLRFALEDYLQETGVSFPHELVDHAHIPRNKLIYFLYNVCSPQIMDLSGLFDSTTSLMDERILVLQILADIDPEVPAYLDEIQEIAAKRLIQDGLQIVDSSRVHVDTPAISRWAAQRYAESFERYLELVGAGIGVAEDFSKLLRRTFRSTDQSSEFFAIPSNEADDLLLDIVLALKDVFLNSTEHGLQYYLGKRIRHGTVTGHLRGPLEAGRLITQRVTGGGQYRPNSYWLDKLQFFGSESREIVERAFTGLAEGYDTLIDSLRNERLHVQSKEKPGGIFHFAFTTWTFHVIRSTAQRDGTFSGFLQSCYSVFWARLDEAFEEARTFIGRELKEEAVRLFDTLQAVVRANCVQDACYSELSSNIRETSVEVQRQFESMAEWFRRTEVEQATHRFELRTLLQIAVESALKTHKGFTPNIKWDVIGDARAPASVLVVISDIMFVVLDNICRRAQCGSSPEVTIRCVVDKKDEKLKLEISNPVGSIDRSSVESRLEEIRAKIDADDIQSHASKDVNSGLLKIAAMTTRKERRELTFGFSEDGQFRTAIGLSIILAPTGIRLSTESAE